MRTHSQKGVVAIEHVLPGRVRLRSHGFKYASAVNSLRESLAYTKGVVNAEHNVKTGSMLVYFEPGQIEPEVIRAEAERAVQALEYQQKWWEHPRETTILGSPLARSFARFWEELDDDMFHRTHGKVDLGTIMPFAFLIAGLGNVVFTKKLPSPPWFNLFWWSFRSFMVLNRDAIVHAFDEDNDEAAL